MEPSRIALSPRNFPKSQYTAHAGVAMKLKTSLAQWGRNATNRFDRMMEELQEKIHLITS